MGLACIARGLWADLNPMVSSRSSSQPGPSGMAPHRVTVLKDQGCPPGLGFCTPLPEVPPHCVCMSGASCPGRWEPLRATPGSNLSWPPPPSGGLSPSNRSPCLDFGLVSAKGRGGRAIYFSCSFPIGPHHLLESLHSSSFRPVSVTAPLLCPFRVAMAPQSFVGSLSPVHTCALSPFLQLLPPARPHFLL